MEEAALFSRLGEVAARGITPSLGIMGGTFDPIHRGHTILAVAAAQQLGLDGLLFIPAGVPSFKRYRRLASADDRLAMVRLATDGLAATAVSDREIRRPGITYAIDTLNELASEGPRGMRLVYIMGSDTLATFSQWYRAADVAALCEVAVASRRGQNTEVSDILEQTELPLRVHRLEGVFPEVSSTGLRAQLARGEVPRDLLAPEVFAYIAARGLYGFATEGDGVHDPR